MENRLLTKKDTFAFFIDFSKAFDCMDCGLLWKKLEKRYKETVRGIWSWKIWSRRPIFHENGGLSRPNLCGFSVLLWNSDPPCSLTRLFHFRAVRAPPMDRGGWSPIFNLPLAAIYAHATQDNPLSQKEYNCIWCTIIKCAFSDNHEQPPLPCGWAARKYLI